MTHNDPNPLTGAIRKILLEAEQARVLQNALRSASTHERASHPLPTSARTNTPRPRTNAQIERAHQKTLAKSALRRAIAAGVHTEPVDRNAIIARDNSTCYLCGKVCAYHEIHIDHIVPIARGGSHTPTNLAVSCARCNTSKGSKLTTLRPSGLT